MSSSSRIRMSTRSSTRSAEAIPANARIGSMAGLPVTSVISVGGQGHVDYAAPFPAQGVEGDLGARATRDGQHRRLLVVGRFDRRATCVGLAIDVLESRDQPCADHPEAHGVTRPVRERGHGRCASFDDMCDPVGGQGFQESRCLQARADPDTEHQRPRRARAPSRTWPIAAVHRPAPGSTVAVGRPAGAAHRGAESRRLRAVSPTAATVASANVPGPTTRR